ncbi:hypothetical protein SFRURICE_000651 [Spodoptera frugiperda]|nr:hypothetical protein SFRURICE_000651 [Spodoptera frugiperda]
MCVKFVIGQVLNYKLLIALRQASYASDASHATDFSLSSKETHTTMSTDPHCTDRISGNAYMQYVPMTSYGISIPKIRVKVALAIRLFSPKRHLIIFISVTLKEEKTKEDLVTHLR